MLNYLEKLNDALKGKASADEEYEWMLLELFDQIVRDRRGGEMGRFLRRPDLKIHDFIKSRIGREAEGHWVKNSAPMTMWEKIRKANAWMLVEHARNIMTKSLVRAVAGRKAAEAFDTGIFRRSGEIHFRLYDRYSLQKLLAAAGFIKIRVCRADESKIPDFNTFGLDMLDGEVRKPDSLFMEAEKP